MKKTSNIRCPCVDKTHYLLKLEKDDDTDSDSNDPINDITMMDINIPDKDLKRLNKVTLALSTYYPLHLGYRQAGQT